MDEDRLGVWVAGATGDIAATLVAGSRGIARGAISDCGLVTARPPFDRLPLAPVGQIILGGTDISSRSITERVESLQRQSRTLPPDLLFAISEDLKLLEPDFSCLPGMSWDPLAPDPSGMPLVDLIRALREEIGSFRARHGLARVVVVNLISAGPEPTRDTRQDGRSGLEELIADDRRDLVSPSVCYAYAALCEGCAYLNFTPNTCTGWGGIAETADDHRLPFYGDDGKTGETLLKTALAPMFAARNLQVMSWEGVNLLGNDDGRSLDDPRNRVSKVANKEQVLASILGYEPHAGVSINYVPSLGDWKTAWDLIHFRGFMDVPMTMQFTWQGCDSVLAAPLVLDMVRLADLAMRRGESGPMKHLASFFKHPVGVDEMDFHRQFEGLVAYADAVLAEAG